MTHSDSIPYRICFVTNSNEPKDAFTVNTFSSQFTVRQSKIGEVKLKTETMLIQSMTKDSENYRQSSIQNCTFKSLLTVSSLKITAVCNYKDVHLHRENSLKWIRKICGKSIINENYDRNRNVSNNFVIFEEFFSLNVFDEILDNLNVVCHKKLLALPI